MKRFVIACAALPCFWSTASVFAAGDVTQEIVARERASFVAWQKKDRAFMEDYLADDATYFDRMLDAMCYVVRQPSGEPRAE